MAKKGRQVSMAHARHYGVAKPMLQGWPRVAVVAPFFCFFNCFLVPPFTPFYVTCSIDLITYKSKQKKF